VLTLHDLQTGFVNDLKADTLECLQGVVKPGRFDANALMQVYRNNYFISLTDVLRSLFPAVDKLVGAAFFDFVAHQFIRQNPSVKGDLHVYGQQFPEFLHSLEQLNELVYLPDIARIDWAWHTVFHGADARSLQSDKLQHIAAEDYPRLVFSLIPAHVFLCSEYSVVQMWQYCMNEDEQAGIGKLSYDEGSDHMLVYRCALKTQLISLPSAEYYFLQAVDKGDMLEEAVEIATNYDPHFNLPKVLQDNFQRGLITDVGLAEH
jgi:hypothetical protein